MSNYAIIKGNTVVNLIVADQAFADSIGAIQLENGFGIGDSYINGTFVKKSIDTIRLARIAESKTAIADYLSSHPLTWTDGKQYSVTEDKQALLTGNLAAYQLAVTLGQTAELTWNATGEECTVWTFESLAALAIAIKAYVKPLVAYQQAYEVSVSACTTEESIMAVPLDYESVTRNA